MTDLQIKEMFQKLFTNTLSFEESQDFLVFLYKKGESAQDIATAASVMREHSIKLDIDDTLRAQLIDVVGTGGDKSNSFNISSTVSLLLAAGGSYVAKHGNRAITSNSGSADMLEGLGINLNLEPKKQVTLLQESGFTFMFAMNHHPAMKHIMPVRKSLGHRSIFNILGPLTNPAGAKKYLLGVFSKDFIDRLASALYLLDTDKSVVLSSRDGMDEISICDITYARLQEGAKSSEIIIDPREYGMKIADKKEIVGGNATENAHITLDIFNQKIKGAKRDIVLLNAAMAFVVDGKARDMKDGLEMSAALLDSGRVAKHLKKIIDISHKL